MQHKYMCNLKEYNIIEATERSDISARERNYDNPYCQR